MPVKTEMKVSRKKKKLEEVDAPSEAATAPVEFITMQELLAASGMMPVGDEEEMEPEIDESPKWEVHIDGHPLMEARGTKFSVFTTGESRSGQMVIEFLTKPGVNSTLFGWLQKPSEKKVRMVVRDHEENRIEQWEMLGVPVAIAVDELDNESKSPWATTLQVSVKDIKIT